MADDGERLLTPSEVAALFRVDPKTVGRRATRKPKELPTIRTPGNHRRYRESDVLRLLAGVPYPDDDE